MGENARPCKNRKVGHPTSKTETSSKTRRSFKDRGSGGLLGGALALVGDFGEFPGFYVVDEAAHGDVLDIGVVPDAGDLAADILLDVLKGVEMRWADS